jgi:hypothetical protein
MAVAEPAHRVTFKTIGGILLAAFFAASVGFYVHTTNARDIPGYIVDVRLLSTCVRASVFRHSPFADARRRNFDESKR